MKCLGCQTSFKEGDKLMMEDLKVEYKNYNLPIREDKARRTLVKTIVSFLNSKGGTIYIGVEDNKGQVRGVELYEEDKAQFTKFLKDLASKIRPQVFVDSDSLINHYFIPVLSKRGFENKYVVKIHVKQGDTSRLYCFIHELSLLAENQEERHQILYSYFRHNMGGVQELRGVALLTEIRNRSLLPREPAAKGNHACNPEPLVPEESPCNVLILDVSSGEHKDIQLFFRENLAELGIKFIPNYRADRQALLLAFSEATQFEKTNSILKQSLEYLNQINNKYAFKMEGCNKKETNLLKIDKFASPKKQTLESKTPIPSEPKTQEKTPKHHKIVEEQQIPERKDKNSAKKIEVKAPQVSKGLQNVENAKSANTGKVGKVRFPKKYSITFSHLDKLCLQNLVQFLLMLNRQGAMEFIKYQNTLQVFLQSEQQKRGLYQVLMEHHLELKQFGFKQKCILWGKNEGILIFKNYDSNKRHDMQKYLVTLIKEEMQNMGFQKIGKNSYVGVCLLKNNEKACIWLDRLLGNYEFKNRFGLAGSKEGKSAKMKITLLITNDYGELLENSSDYML